MNTATAREFPQVSDEPTLEEMTKQVVTLSRSFRNAAGDAPSVDPKTILRTSGRMMLASDAAALMLACLCGGAISGLGLGIHAGVIGLPLLFSAAFGQLATFIGLGAVALLWLDSRGHYRQRLPFWESTGQILAVAVVGFILAGFTNFAVHNQFSRLWLGASWLLFGVFMMVGRSLVRSGLDRAGRWRIPAVMVGEGPSVQSALRALHAEKAMGFDVTRQLPTAYLNRLTSPESWKTLMLATGAGHIFLALDGEGVETHRSALRALVRERLPCSFVPYWIGLPSTTLSVHHFMLHDVLLIHDTNRLRLPLPRIMKRMFDICASLAALSVLWPILVMVGVMVRRDGGPAFFRQNRVGHNGKLFGCLKFRSMRVDAEEFFSEYLEKNPEAKVEWTRFQKLKNDVRITKVGNLIRRTSIDELPQLINVLKGDMSLVGPRPIMPDQSPLYGDDFTHYTSVRPGITGPWQVSGRNNLTFSERVSLEATYARNWHFWMDIVIILRTLPAVLGKENAY